MTRSHTTQDLRQERFERACWWLNQEVDVVPVKPRSKQLQPGYGPRKAHIADVSSARKWFLRTDANLGIVLGEVKGLVVADWDDVRDYETWRSTAGALVDTLSEQTARGYHLFFFAQGLPSAVGEGCEFKAKGVCTVSPSVHPSGVVYRITNDAPIVQLDQERACQLFPFLSEILNKRDRGEASNRATNTMLTKPRRLSEGGGVVARIKEARPTLDEMTAYGIQLRRGGENALVGLCPFHDDHSPSLWVNPKSGLWGCNQPKGPAAGIHDVINFRALARGISNAAAIRQLAQEFL